MYENILIYMNGENEDVRDTFAKIGKAERALLRADREHRPSVIGERYLTGNKVRECLHVSRRTLQTLRDRRQIPYTVISGRVFLYPETGIRDLLGRNLKPAEKR